MNINTQGTWTLYRKEVRRFLKVYNQTLFAPVVTALLFLAIFNLALGDRVKTIGGVSFATFMAAGLIMMSIVQHAFANSSSSLTMGKVLGCIIDYLMPPLTPGEITFGVTMGAVTRGILVGILVAFAISLFVPLGIHHLGFVLFHIFAASIMLGLLGMIGGIFAESFDQMAAFTNYIITPLAFLSGTFYSVKQLPEFWYTVSQFNPFFYMIDGFRFGMTGYHDGNLTIGVIVLLSTIICLWSLVYYLLKIGYRVKQ